MLAVRVLRTFLLTRRIADLVVAVGIVWLATSLVAALTLTYVQIGWWLGHGLELDGILVVGIPVALDLARTRRSRGRSPATCTRSSSSTPRSGSSARTSAR